MRASPAPTIKTVNVLRICEHLPFRFV
jgi:hypothetical protein